MSVAMMASAVRCNQEAFIQAHHHAIRATMMRGAMAAILDASDALIGRLSDSAIQAFGIVTSARDVILTAGRRKQHIRIEHADDYDAVMRSLAGVVEHPEQWARGNQADRYLLLGRISASARRIKVVIDLEFGRSPSDPPLEWIIRTAFVLQGARYERERHKYKPV